MTIPASHSSDTGKLEQLSAACHHLGFYHNVGLSAHYRLSSTLSASTVNLNSLILKTVARVILKHGILFAIPVDEDSPNAYFARLDSIDLARSVTFMTRSQSRPSGNEDAELDALLQAQHNTNFKSEYGSLPFWRLIITYDSDLREAFTASFIFHHAIGDGAAGLIFHKEFRNALNIVVLSDLKCGPDSTVVYAPIDIKLLPPIEYLHPLPMNDTPAQPAPHGIKGWTGGLIRAPCVTHYRTLYVSPTVSQTFIQQCKKRGLSVTAAIPSIIAKEFFDVLSGDVDALTCIIPVNLRPWLNLSDSGNAIGTFIDAFKVLLRRSDHVINEDNTPRVPLGASGTSKEIARYLTGNLSPTGEPYTAIAVFKTIPDVAVVFNSTLGKPRDAAFEVSNLGAFTGSAAAGEDTPWQLGRTIFSRSSVVSGAAVTMSLVSGGDGGLNMGFSWQEGVVDDDVVDKLMQGVRRHFESDDAW